MSRSLSELAIAPVAAHLAGWLWTVYLVPVVIVVVPLLRSQLIAQKAKRPTAPSTPKRKK